MGGKETFIHSRKTIIFRLELKVTLFGFVGLFDEGTSPVELATEICVSRIGGEVGRLDSRLDLSAASYTVHSRHILTYC